MKNTLMITASLAALVAAGGLASAQGTREQPAVAAPEQKAPDGKTDRKNLNVPQKVESVKPGPAAQLPEGKADQKANVPEKKGNTPQKVESVKPAPAAQLPEGKTDQKANVPEKKNDTPQKAETVKPAPAPAAQLPEKPAAKPEGTVGQGGGMKPSSPAPNAAVESKPAPAALSTEHRAQMWETIRSEKVQPLTNVQFSITIGEAVPRTVHLYTLSPRIIEYAPQYRGYEYILVGDDILIIDPRTLRIVAVISA